MKYSYNWLKEISKVNVTPEKMADQLMMHSFEVESIENLDRDLRFENIVVGKILEIKKHPNADRLQLTKIDIGSKKLDIICGAFNIKVNDKVPVALVGAKLQSGIEIKAVEIRGVKSFGMLCAEDELGLGNSRSGILILGKDAKVGEELSKVLELKDTIFEIKVLPDRGHDALCHIGMAREVAALNDKKFASSAKSPLRRQTNKLTVEIKDKKLCPRYIGAVLQNIKIQPSPAWAKNRLLSLGIKPINNVVDATNFVMLELGQPLHAFDYDIIKSKITNSKSQIPNKTQNSNAKIVVRKASAGEKIKLLDGTVKELTAEDLVIANENKALALAGIMGGEDSGINENTTSIVIESANFDATSIRRSRTRLGIKTEASDRYEKGIDPNLCEKAMARVIEIIKFFGADIDGMADNYPSKVKPWNIKLDLEYVNKLLGENIPSKVAVKILNLLEIETSIKGKSIIAKIPTVRIDLKTQEDLIEEIGRIYGYEKIKSQAPLAQVQTAKINENREFEKLVKDILVSEKFSEVYNYSFYGQRDAGLANLSEIKHLELQNPMNPDQALLRVSLILNILKNIRENLKNFGEFQIFEIGKVYWPNGNVLPEEKNMLVGALVLEKDKKAESFFELKGSLDSIFEKLGIVDYYFNDFECSPADTPLSLWHATRCSELKAEGKKESFGYLGEINPLVLSNFDVHKRVAMFELDMEKLREISKLEKEFMPINKYPISSRDISLIAPSGTIVEEILQSIQRSGGELILRIELFDIFDFEEKNETSFAFRIFFGDKNRTLKNEEVELAMKKIIDNLEKDLKVKVRK